MRWILRFLLSAGYCVWPPLNRGAFLLIVVALNDAVVYVNSCFSWEFNRTAVNRQSDVLAHIYLPSGGQ